MSEEIIIEEDDEVVYEEVSDPQVIETGDSVKVKQVLDESTLEAIQEAGFTPDYAWDNFKLLLMFVSCLFALLAQFYPMPFPESRPLLAFCCATYFILSGVIQFIVTFIDKDTIMFFKPRENCKHAIRIRTDFPRFQEYFTLIAQIREDKENPDKPRCTTAKMYVGKYFTEKGEYDEDAYKKDVKKHMENFVAEKYTEFHYNHKMD